jgi:hypothetical protein
MEVNWKMGQNKKRKGESRGDERKREPESCSKVQNIYLLFSTIEEFVLKACDMSK